MPTKIEPTLEKSQQGVSDDVLVAVSSSLQVLKLKKSYTLSWKPCQGDSLNLLDHSVVTFFWPNSGHHTDAIVAFSLFIDATKNHPYPSPTETTLRTTPPPSSPAIPTADHHLHGTTFTSPTDACYHYQLHHRRLHLQPATNTTLTTTINSRNTTFISSPPLPRYRHSSSSPRLHHLVSTNTTATTSPPSPPSPANRGSAQPQQEGLVPQFTALKGAFGTAARK
nr:hypothetical protein [Tanacetum cinerariifolium]